MTFFESSSQMEQKKSTQKRNQLLNAALDVFSVYGFSGASLDEIAQLGIIQEYLPKQLSAEELETEIRRIIAETGASSMKEMGKVMGAATKQLAGKTEGRLISEMVKKLLS